SRHPACSQISPLSKWLPADAAMYANVLTGRIAAAGLDDSIGCAHARPDTPPRKQPRLGRGHDARGSRILLATLAPAIAALSLDRLLRQPRAREPDRRTAAGTDVRPSQRRHGRRRHGSALFA